MNDSIVGYKDRKTGLIIFGILEILAGAFVAFMILLMFAGQAIQAQTHTTEARLETGALLSVVMAYGLLALVFVTIGIGSIRARRWARALSLILFWGALIMGIFMVGIMGTVMLTVADHATAATKNIVWVTTVIMLLVETVILIVIPIAGIIFYGNKHVKATCEARNPAACWTDHCPLPVLAFCLLTLLGALIFLLMLFNHPVFPFFGAILHGIPAAIVSLVLAVLWLYSAWEIYRLAVIGWWIQLCALLVFGVSNVLTFTRHGILDYYQAAGYGEQQLAQMKQGLEMFNENTMLWLMIIPCVLWLGYLLWIKKYFRKTEQGR